MTATEMLPISVVCYDNAFLRYLFFGRHLSLKLDCKKYFHESHMW